MQCFVFISCAHCVLLPLMQMVMMLSLPLCFTSKGIDVFVSEWILFFFIFFFHLFLVFTALLLYYHFRWMQHRMVFRLLVLLPPPPPPTLLLLLFFLDFAHKTLKWFYMRFYLIQCSSSSVFCEIALSQRAKLLFMYGYIWLGIAWHGMAWLSISLFSLLQFPKLPENSVQSPIAP